MDFPLGELMDESACYAKPRARLHPDGLRCPQCGAREHIGVHRYRRREAVPDHRCDECGRVFNAFTGTERHGTRRQSSTVLLLHRPGHPDRATGSGAHVPPNLAAGVAPPDSGVGRARVAPTGVGRPRHGGR
ncbi:hypothetical protein GobsT_74490 [Gemmata obscuriglobus]|uniref:Transposase zinc-ribbon domain-containing protein n=1 Tax=Gemmata obscuriglobus TaxID=114 RepID=A0A2Z3H3Y8_9BACT|nr:hypothetical protein C1280_33865 [Gemmata obscuriglobus]QEG32593.1 hypothetical protein GobsT_74490 [Gemmata obscuriglobus]VTS11949.1 Uncharacterized protein OS=Chloroflexus aggregans (strain MD-66 / DSM 9485) GN=Cagg_0685 PE=4 SV=1 [Gemmata obscuriglobus UQM 2246]